MQKKFSGAVLFWAVAAIGAAQIQAQTIYGVTKPLVLLTLIVWFAVQLRSHRSREQSGVGVGVLVLAGLVFGLIGDICLLFEAGFLFGLVAFLIGHLCYGWAFRLDSQRLADPTKVYKTSLRVRSTIVILGLVVGLFYAVLWSHLSPFMRLAVGLYCSVIGWMAVVAVTRYFAYQGLAQFAHRPSAMVALGALLFMLSDSLLAINRFLSPIEWDAVLILTPYFTAQYLIARFMSPQATNAGQTGKVLRA